VSVSTPASEWILKWRDPTVGARVRIRVGVRFSVRVRVGVRVRIRVGVRFSVRVRVGVRVRIRVGVRL
jgi:UDP-3-O-[3-hydroxymyristoyl] glucosamine N-acyltransferase